MGIGSHPPEFSKKLILIGASTGGPGILLKILRDLPETTPGIVIVQHLCEGFSVRLAEYLDQQCRMKVKEAGDPEAVCCGTVYVAPGGRHLKLKKGGQGYVMVRSGRERRNGVCPSADVLFESAACAGRDAMGIILSGMGKDGAQGLLAMYNSGAVTICQNEKSSPIYGMPMEAKRAGGVMEELPPELIVDRILRFSGIEK